MSKTLKIQGNKMFVDGNCVKEYSKKLSTKPLEEILEEFDKKDVFPFGCWHDHPSGYERRKAIIIDFITQAFQAGKDSMREEILNKLPKRKSENKKKKDQEEWINIPRIQRAVGFNSCLSQVKNIIKKV